ncbi:hypothetical protein HMPREF3232_00777 [Fannyhessea vaginae]|nr:hypothetical protein HMPREF3232_00777 [Fannyhessea vaginae]
MKVIYTEDQKKHAIQTYKKYKSYSKTLRVLGYQSRHVLFDWVEMSGSQDDLLKSLKIYRDIILLK